MGRVSNHPPQLLCTHSLKNQFDSRFLYRLTSNPVERPAGPSNGKSLHQLHLKSAVVLLALLFVQVDCRVAQPPQVGGQVWEPIDGIHTLGLHLLHVCHQIVEVRMIRCRPGSHLPGDPTACCRGPQPNRSTPCIAFRRPGSSHGTYGNQAGRPVFVPPPNAR